MRTGLVPDVAPRVHVALHVDATHAVQGYLRVHETTTIPAGPLTLVYPKWIPGEFAPNGPIPNVADLAISAGGKSLAWTRDPVDLYAFHVNAPAGELAIDFTFLGGETAGYDTGRLATANMLSLEWNKVLLTPFEENDRSVVVTPSIEPTADWKYATALTTAHAAGATIAFEPATLNELADSPLDAGTNADDPDGNVGRRAARARGLCRHARGTRGERRDDREIPRARRTDARALPLSALRSLRLPAHAHGRDAGRGTRASPV